VQAINCIHTNASGSAHRLKVKLILKNEKSGGKNFIQIRILGEDLPAGQQILKCRIPNTECLHRGAAGHAEKSPRLRIDETQRM